MMCNGIRMLSVVSVLFFCPHGVILQQLPPATIPDIPSSVITMDMIMSGRTPDCDDGKTNLTVDWNEWAVDYWCFGNRWKVAPVDTTAVNIPICGPKPPQALHYCMKDTITYTDVPPTSGNHRPSWAVYGEYTYLPPQRWLHNLEHGAVVVLYHPCADAGEVDKLRKIVSGCLRRHVITPYNKLTKNAPFALLTWGCKFLMSSVDTNAAIKFIQEHAKHGPEDLDIEGQFTDQLRTRATIVSDLNDSILCPTQQQRRFDIPKRFFM